MTVTPVPSFPDPAVGLATFVHIASLSAVLLVAALLALVVLLSARVLAHEARVDGQVRLALRLYVARRRRWAVTGRPPLVRVTPAGGGIRQRGER